MLSCSIWSHLKHSRECSYRIRGAVFMNVGSESVSPNAVFVHRPRFPTAPTPIAFRVRVKPRMAEVKVFYDRQGKTLTLSFTDRSLEYVCEETGNEVVLMKDHTPVFQGRLRSAFLSDCVRTCRPGVQVHPGARLLSRNRVVAQFPIVAVERVVRDHLGAPRVARANPRRGRNRDPRKKLVKMRRSVKSYPCPQLFKTP
jgi:hypothetical protein